MDVMDYLNQAKVSLFRYEGLQDYEGDDFDHIEESMKDWWSFIQSKTDKGVQMQRVRLILEPATPYLKKELEIHKISAGHGDDIRIIYDAPEMEDFWLIDDSTVLLMKYSKEGIYLGFDVIKNNEAYVNIKEKLLRSSKPLIKAN